LTKELTAATPHPDVQAMADLWPLPRTLYQGTRAMRGAGKTYLPKEAAESEEAYTARLNRTVLFNAFAKTVGDMAGRVFAKEVAFGDDSLTRLVEWSENIDLTGRHLNVFASDLFKDAMQVGLAHILVDSPIGNEATTRADQGRPYFVHLRAEDVIGWTHVVTDDGLKLDTLRFYETVEEAEGIHVSRVTQIRVLLPGAYQVWRQNEKKEWFLYVEGVRGIDDIPLATVYLARTGFMTAKPPLQDLADLNVTHWQSSSDQRNILHVARVPILFGAGFPEDVPLVIGSSSLTRASDPNSKLSYVEHSGAAIGSGENDLKSLEFQMQAMGLQLLVSEPGQSATGEVRDDIKENSRLAMWADALKDGLERAFGFMAQIGGLGTEGGSLVVNKDFGIHARGSVEVSALLMAVEKGVISKETAIREFIRRGILSDDIDPETELEAAADDALAAIETAQAGMQEAAPPMAE
jgi:hypothetical protein